MKPILSEGDVIQCPNCNIDIATVTKDSYENDIVDESMFNTLVGDNKYLSNGTPALCYECGADLIHPLEGHFYIKNKGWTNETK